MNASANSAGVGLGWLPLARCIQPAVDVAPTRLPGQVLLHPSGLYDSAPAVAVLVGILPFVILAGAVFFILLVANGRGPR